MKNLAAIFVVLILFLGLLNSYQKYKKGLYPKKLILAHALLVVSMLIFSFFMLFE